MSQLGYVESFSEVESNDFPTMSGPGNLPLSINMVNIWYNSLGFRYFIVDTLEVSAQNLKTPRTCNYVRLFPPCLSNVFPATYMEPRGNRNTRMSLDTLACIRWPRTPYYH